MDKDYSPDLITLIDEDDVEHCFEILDTTEYEGKEYYALYPVFESPEEELLSSGEYYIMEAATNGDDFELSEVDDDDLIDALSEIFENHFEEKFSDEE